jgi:hypothetical protein
MALVGASFAYPFRSWSGSWAENETAIENETKLAAKWQLQMKQPQIAAEWQLEMKRSLNNEGSWK